MEDVITAERGSTTMESSRRYTPEEATRIIKKALKAQNNEFLSHDELLDMAKDLGLDEQTLEGAIEKEHVDHENDQTRRVKLARRKAHFHRHLWSYIIVIGALIIINIMTPGPWWFQWPFFGWGIGLAFHFRAAYFPAGEELE